MVFGWVARWLAAGRTARVRAPPRRASSRPLAGTELLDNHVAGPPRRPPRLPSVSVSSTLSSTLNVLVHRFRESSGITRVVGVTSVGGVLHAGAAHLARLPDCCLGLPWRASPPHFHLRPTPRIRALLAPAPRPPRFRSPAQPAAEATRVVSSRRVFLPIRVARIRRRRSTPIARGGQNMGDDAPNAGTQTHYLNKEEEFGSR